MCLNSFQLHKAKKKSVSCLRAHPAWGSASSFSPHPNRIENGDQDRASGSAPNFLFAIAVEYLDIIHVIVIRIMYF